MATKATKLKTTKATQLKETSTDKAASKKEKVGGATVYQKQTSPTNIRKSRTGLKVDLPGGDVAEDGQEYSQVWEKYKGEKKTKTAALTGATGEGGTPSPYDSLGYAGSTPTASTPSTQTASPSAEKDWKGEYERLLSEKDNERERQDQIYRETLAAEREAKKAEREAKKKQTRDDLWESLEYTYGKKREKSDREYDQLASRTDRQMLSRGMQRSSYGAQTLANVGRQKIEAQGDIYDAQIADYHDRVTQLERDEQQQENWEAQFDETRRQYDTNLAYQRERAAVQDTQWQKSFEENARQFNENLASNERIAAGHDATSIATANISAQASMYSADTSRAIAQMQDATSRWATEQQMGLSREQMAQQAGLTREQMALQRELSQASQSSSDLTASRSWAMQLLTAGVMPSDAELQAIGMTKEQAEKLLKKPASAQPSRPTNPTNPNPTNPQTPQQPSDSSFLSSLFGGSTGSGSGLGSFWMKALHLE